MAHLLHNGQLPDLGWTACKKAKQPTIRLNVQPSKENPSSLASKPDGARAQCEWSASSIMRPSVGALFLSLFHQCGNGFWLIADTGRSSPI
jgi:hypothetical protein